MKRSFDIAVSGLGLLVFLFPLAIVAWKIHRKMGNPVFFRQMRPGMYGEPFELLKFRTMTNELDPYGQLLSDAKRLTNFGQFLRATSMDELPALWNVFRGDMSLVGPRPLLMEYLPFYSTEQARRHNMRPGITGWAQVNGRNALSWEEKFRLDVWYVDNQSFLLDLKIIFLTAKKVLLRDGISAAGEATMPRFTGNQKDLNP
jgi:lipopolysaccharide/colanic/teichoic acid biosynthesis glycosyltransferase